MSKRIKIYGERNTNTNYMSQLISLNLDLQEVPGIAPPGILKLQNILPGKERVRDIYFYLTYKNNLGWKHTCVKPVKVLRKYNIVNSNLCFLTITKNPYSWLLSLHRTPYHRYHSRKQDFESFLQTPWRTLGRDNTKTVLKSPVELWNIKNASYLQLAEENTLNITTEKTFEDPEAVIDAISSKFSIRKLSNNFSNYERSTKDESKDSDYYRDYYLNEVWRGDISEEAASIINEGLDKNLMDTFGYDVIP